MCPTRRPRPHSRSGSGLASESTAEPRRTGRPPGLSFFSKRQLTPEEERAYTAFLADWNETLDGPQRDLTAAIERGDIDARTLSSTRADVDYRVGVYANDIETTYRTGARRGASAGRELASRRHALDVAFNVVPSRTLRELDTWSVDLSREVTETMVDDLARYIRGAHVDGVGAQQLARDMNADLFDGQLRGWKAEQLARDNTIAPSNAGAHSAYADATAVVAERWVATFDGRQRATHGDAHGQTVAVESTFDVGGYHARYPGDTSLPIAESTNCRCTIVPVTADELSASQLATIEDGGRLWL